MKISSIFHVLVFFMVLLIFSMPLVSRAQENSVQTEAMTAAVADANKSVNKLLWFGGGCLLAGVSLVTYGIVDSSDTFFSSFSDGICLLPVVGLVGAYFYQPVPQPYLLIGKSPEYIAAYIVAYQLEKGLIQAQWASAGCLSGGVGLGVLFLGFAIGQDSAQE